MAAKCVVSGLVVGAILAAGSSAFGQYSSDFEAPTYNGSAAGTPLTTGFGGGGQAGWYNPVAGSIDFNVHTYAGNTMGFVANPNGNDQFVGIAGTAAPNNIGRAQQNVNFGAGGTWTVEWDVIGQFVGAAGVTPVNNIGSFSLQPSASANYWQQLMRYMVPVSPTAYEIVYGVFPAAGGAAPAFQSPGVAWTNIPMNEWIHQSTTWDFATNQILSVSIQNITTGGPVTTVDVSGLGWYLAGGANNVLAKPAPTDIRLFTGNVNNGTGWDNVKTAPAPAPCYPDCNGDMLLNLADFGCFQTAFATGNMYADCNGDTILNLADFGCFQTKFAIGCP